MTDNNENDSGEPQQRKPLSLNRNLGSGVVRQSFSHGRSKTVVVEVKKKRGLDAPKSAGTDNASPKPSFVPTTTLRVNTAAAPVAREAVPDTSQAMHGLSQSEMRARQGALERAQEAETQRQERERREREARAAREELDAQRRQEQERLQKLEQERLEREREESSDNDEASTAKTAKPAYEPKGLDVRPTADAEIEDEGEAEEISETTEEGEDLLSELGGRVKKQKQQVLKIVPVARTKNAPQRRSGRLTITAALEDGGDRQRSLASVRRAREKERERRMGKQEPLRQSREVTIPEAITVADLANRMAERLTDVVKYLMKQGQMLKGNDVLDADTAELIATDFGHVAKRVAESDVEIGLEGVVDTDTNQQPRPPVVTIMGHVDHGKTSLLDAIRQADVVSGEAGGITQHIGAYQVRLPSGEKVTFLDTPGHAAFSAMRSRGAKVTDIVVLVVAADDGVMPQTIEAINHAKAANVPMIVAVNKIDKPSADASKVLSELLQYEVVTEEFGGDVLAVQVSALKKTGLDKLLETIMLQAEVLELGANPNRSAEGIVIEAKLDKGRGPIATVLVQRGTMKRGDIIVAGSQWGRVRVMSDERGQALEEAGPSQPVEVLGLDGAPEPGDQLVVVENEARAREVTDYRVRMRRDKAVVRQSARTGLETMLARIKDQKIKEFPFIVKSDVQGSAEAISASVSKLATEEVLGRVIHQGVGGITESDVSLAKSAGAVILAFNVRAGKPVRDLAEAEGVEIRYYSIIYNLIDDVKDILSGLLEPEHKETFIGYAQVLQVFNITKVGKIAGCKVTEGNIKRGCGVRLLRDDVVIHEGKLSTLKRFKDEVSEVNPGQECGMGFTDYQDIREGDQIECFEVEIIKRSL
ncbi:MAG: translation initiation factor IF-2 [Hyphomonadaceae bacterium]|nr:MAG: translation initiation factor IF-2 [Hyphomonadaceae bacterium]